MLRTVACLSVIVALAALVLAQASEEPKEEDPKAKILGHIDKGRAAFAAGKAQEAVDHLQKAIGLIQKTVEKGFAAFLPEAFEGWSRGKPDSASGIWGSGDESFQWTQASCTYRRESDGLGVEITISSSPQLIQPQRVALEMYKSPQMRKMLEMDPNKTYDFIEEGGWSGWIMTDKTGGTTLMALGDKLMVAINIRKAMHDLAKKFWGAIDTAGLAKSGS
ncbi:MAG: hypothetical protein ACYTDY_14515 [Planctomycetota bacterium]|jgi:hypothetical protein